MCRDAAALGSVVICRRLGIQVGTDLDAAFVMALLSGVLGDIRADARTAECCRGRETSSAARLNP